MPEESRIGEGGTLDKLVRTEEGWRRILPPDRCKVLRKKGTDCMNSASPKFVPD
jgi:hypothetical protein